jgi:hypothetical protein
MPKRKPGKVEKERKDYKEHPHKSGAGISGLGGQYSVGTYNEGRKYATKTVAHEIKMKKIRKHTDIHKAHKKTIKSLDKRVKGSEFRNQMDIAQHYKNYPKQPYEGSRNQAFNWYFVGIEDGLKKKHNNLKYPKTKTKKSIPNVLTLKKKK